MIQRFGASNARERQTRFAKARNAGMGADTVAGVPVG
jgi:hypothetical protein